MCISECGHSLVELILYEKCKNQQTSECHYQYTKTGDERKELFLSVHRLLLMSMFMSGILFWETNFINGVLF